MAAIAEPVFESVVAKRVRIEAIDVVRGVIMISARPFSSCSLAPAHTSRYARNPNASCLDSSLLVGFG